LLHASVVTAVIPAGSENDGVPGLATAHGPDRQPAVERDELVAVPDGEQAVGWMVWPNPTMTRKGRATQQPHPVAWRTGLPSQLSPDV